jgi:hypothetical protein
MSQEQRKTNVEAVVDLMEFSKHGALAQLFVVDALSKYARHVANAPAEAFASMKGGIISPEAWQDVAREIADKIDTHLGHKPAEAVKTTEQAAEVARER